jgi:hypothetical protein
VTLEGSPLLVLEETRRLGQEEVDAIQKRGQAQRDLQMLKNNMLRRSGRNSMFGSIFVRRGHGGRSVCNRQASRYFRQPHRVAVSRYAIAAGLQS